MNKIKLLFLDVDGTLTDGKIYMGNEGEVFKAFDVKDGCGIHDILPKHNIIPVIITARNSEILKRRCEELKIVHLYQGCRNKKEKMIEVAYLFGLTCNENEVIEQTAYMGDDIVDLQSMEIAEIKGCPRDAVEEVIKVSDFVSKYKGGNGAVREFIEWIVKMN